MNIPLADTTSIPGVVIPEAFKQPEWVDKTFNEFRDAISEDFRKSKTLNHTLFRNLFKQLILDGKISPTWPLNKKNVSKLLSELYEKCDNEEFQWRYFLIYRIGFFISTLTSSSFTPNSLTLPDKFKPQKQKIIQEYNTRLEEAKNETQREKAYIWVDKAFRSLAKEVLDYFRENIEDYPVVELIDSGAKGSQLDLQRLLIAVGLSINAKGEINDVIDKGHSEGLNQTQFFNYTSQAIVTQYQKSSDTAIPGYLIRQLNTITSGIVLSKTYDCESNRHLSIKILDKGMLKSFEGKMRLKNGKYVEITSKDTDLIGTTVKIRSALHCKATDGICTMCYNPAFVERMNLTENAGIGLLASSANAVTLTSLTLKGAHVGLTLDKEETDLQKDIYEFSE